MAGFWKKALIYLGLVEEDDELEPLPEVHEPPQLETVRPIRTEPEPSSVRTVSPGATEPATAMPQEGPRVLAPQVRIHVVEPKSYNEAKEIGDKLKVDQPVFMNLQDIDASLAQRLFDFATGLTYGLSGTIKKVADRAFLLSPANVEVSAEETERIMSERGFFNQF